MTRRQLLALGIGGAAFAPLLLTGCDTNGDAGNGTSANAREGEPGAAGGKSAAPIVTDFRIGHQKADTLNLLKLRGTLDKRLAERGVKVQWLAFPAGPPLLEALGVNSLDFGSTGESPAIFAQAAGTPFVYVANIPNTNNNGDGQALIVPKDSPIQTLADVKGKKIAVARASGAHNFLVQVLQKVGIAYTDIEPVFLAPPDARAAFDAGKVDAWSIWDPYLTVAQTATGARVVINAKGIVSPGPFYLAATTFAKQHGDILKIVLEEIETTSRWGREHIEESADLLAKDTGVSRQTLIDLAKRRPRGDKYVGLRPIDDAVIAEQQQVADNFGKIGILPKPVVIKEATLTPAEYAAINPTHDAPETEGR
ncbi:MAG: aliphatic sulfonate ABC transporter substrate-binding protein [Armatimonadetes bacterium]|nr:aliphatic sulfonate ABC transporter substrate-binding protein [Armatimonadota bacterium]